MFKRYLTISLMLLILFSCGETKEDKTHEKDKRSQFGLVIHGGAGSIYKGRYSEEEEAKFKTVLEEALMKGHEILSGGGTSLDAVENVIHVLENSPLFNAGKGAVLTSEGTAELDAAIMDGATLNAGTAAGIKHVKNPISLARKIMEVSPHVMLIGDGAEVFAEENGLEFVENQYFITDERKAAFQKIKARERKEGLSQILSGENKFGTVGCAALDKYGNLAAGTSTGGMMNKKFGRVGDVPIIGAGTYANNSTCALSATGHGEFFIRNVVTHDISALMEYKNLSLEKAADEVVMKKLLSQNGRGGVIGIDSSGNVVMTFNTDGMFRGYILQDGSPVTALYKE